MLQPFFALILEGAILVAVILAGVVFVGGILLALFSIRKVPPGQVGVRVGLSLGWQWPPLKAKYVMSDTLVYRLPLITRYELMDIAVQRLEISRKGKEGLICKDNIRADIVVAFYIKVNFPAVYIPDTMDSDSNEARQLVDDAIDQPDKIKYAEVKRVAQSVTCERASDTVKLNELFEAKFSEALKTAGKEMDFTDLYTNRQGFRKAIIKVIGHDLEGYRLTDVAIDYLEQTDKDQLDPDNVLDAEGIKKITMVTAGEQEQTNLRIQERDVKIKNDNIRAIKEQRELDRDNEEHLAAQTRAVDEAKAEESAAARQVVEEQRKNEEVAALTAQEEIEVREKLKIREVRSAEIKVDQEVLVLEQKKLEAAGIAEATRGKEVGLREANRDSEIIAAAFEIAKAQAGLEAEEKKATEQNQLRRDVEADMSAARAARVLNVEFEARAQADQKKVRIASEAEKTVRQNLAEAAQLEVRIAAEAKKQAAEEEAVQIQTLAEAEAKASEKENHAMQERAQGTAAMEAASGVAQANVKSAMAAAKIKDAGAEEALGLAEANVIAKQGEARGSATADEGKGEGEAVRAVKLAEAEGKTEMAKAIELFNKASQDHEEFRLQLNKDLEVDLAEIRITKDVAEAQARVVGEALKSANIDIVGGENDFFEKIVKSVIQGRSIDRLMNNSQTLTDVKNTFFTGDPDHFKGQLRSWIQDLGVSSEDVKNLTVAALLTSLMSKADNSGTKSLIRQAQKAAKESGITDIVVSALLGDKAGK